MKRPLQPAVSALLAFGLRTVLTLLVAGLLLVQAHGYTIDFETLSVTKTGLLVVAVEPKAAVIELADGQLEQQSSNWVSQLPGGIYSLSVSFAGYRPWSQSVRIEPGRSTAFPHISLFLDEVVADPPRPATTEELQTPLVGDPLLVAGGELWRMEGEQQLLITRLSTPIHSAQLLDLGHVVFQSGEGIHVMDIDGTNDHLILPTPQSRYRVHVLSKDVIGLLDGTTITTYKIR